MRMWILVAGMLASSTARAEPEAPARWQRLVLETAGMFAAGQAWYYRHGESTNSGDWELPFTWSAVGRKLTGDGFRFDGDGFATNAIAHPLFGATSYLLARENGYGPLGSFAFASVASGLWEVFGEWREYGSINDMLTTSTAGVPLGEVAHQLVHHLDAARLELYGGAGWRGARRIEALGLRADVGGRHGVSVEVPIDTRIRDFEAHSLVAGRSISLGGASGFVGAKTAYRFHEQLERADDPTWDLDAAVRCGPAATIDAERAGVAVHGELAATIDFAMLKSWAYEAWQAQHPTAMVRGVLATNAHPYYYGAAISLSPAVAIAIGGVAAGVAIDTSTIRSLDGHDRYRDMIVGDPHLDDTSFAARAWLSAAAHGVIVRLDVGVRDRRSTIGTTSAEHVEHDALISVGIRR